MCQLARYQRVDYFSVNALQYFHHSATELWIGSVGGAFRRNGYLTENVRLIPVDARQP